MSTGRPLFNFTPDERSEYESAVLRITVAAKIQNYLDDTGLQAKDLAHRIRKSKAWVSKLLSGRQNATLNTLSEVGLAIGARWQIELTSAERAGTPAEQDPPAPQWAAGSATATIQGNSLRISAMLNAIYSRRDSIAHIERSSPAFLEGTHASDLESFILFDIPDPVLGQDFTGAAKMPQRTANGSLQCVVSAE